MASVEWAAGFFDGEGCVGIYKACNGTGHSVRMSLTQKEREPLEVFQSLWGVGTIGPKLQSGVYQWVKSGSGAARVMWDLLPHLICKQDQVRTALAYMQTINKGPSAGLWDYRELLREEIARLKWS